VRRRSYFSRILAPPTGAVLLRPPRSPFPSTTVPAAQPPVFQRAAKPPSVPFAASSESPPALTRDPLPVSRFVAATQQEQDSLRLPRLESRAPSSAGSPALEPHAETICSAAHLFQQESPVQLLPGEPAAEPVPTQHFKESRRNREGNVLESSVPPRISVQQLSSQEPPLESGPRVEIGSIEVRLTPRALPAQRAPRPKSSGPLARHTLPFGLRQI
jgi:hypothetical protein